MIGAFYQLPFGAGWPRLRQLLHLRLTDWAHATRTPLDGFDVVLGVLTGGALLAPLAAQILKVPAVEYLRISRYKDDLYTPMGLARVVVDQWRGRHDAQYRLRDPPETAKVKGKRVLILDDALASGGTLRAARKWCLEAGATEVHGVALKILRGYWHADDDSKRTKAVELQLPIFVPWGTF